MAKNKLKYWLGEGKELLTDIVKTVRTDKEIYEAMNISETSFYEYMKNSAFSEIVKNTRIEQLKDNARRLSQLKEDMWKQAHEQEITETIKEIETKDGKEYKYMKTTTKTLPGDATLQIYLDKTYGKNINSEEVQSRIELNKVRAEVQRLVLNPDLDEGTKQKLQAVKEILGGVDSVIGKAK